MVVVGKEILSALIKGCCECVLHIVVDGCYQEIASAVSLVASGFGMTVYWLSPWQTQFVGYCVSTLDWLDLTQVMSEVLLAVMS